VRRRPERNQRHVFLDAEQIAAAHAALENDGTRNAALALRLALLTGARSGRWCYLSRGRSTSNARYGSNQRRPQNRNVCISCRCNPRHWP
jgi:hypothetical protein